MAVRLPRRLLPITRTLLWRPAQESHVLPGGVPGDDAEPYVLFVTQRTLMEVDSAIRSSAGVTAFGILTGQRFHCPNTDTKYMVISSALWAPSLVVYQSAVPPEMLASAAQDLRPPPGQEILGWYRSGTGVGARLSPSDQDLHLRFFREPWQVMLLSAPHADPLAGGFFAIDRAAMQSGLVPFHELLHPKSLTGRDTKYTCVTWRNYVTDESVEPLPEGDQELVRASADVEAGEAAPHARRTPESVRPVAEPARPAAPRPAAPLRAYPPPDRAAVAARPAAAAGAQPMAEASAKAAAEPVVMPPAAAPPRPMSAPPGARSPEPAEPALEAPAFRFADAAAEPPSPRAPEPVYEAAVDEAAARPATQRAARPATARSWRNGSAEVASQRPATSGLVGSPYVDADQVLLPPRHRGAQPSRQTMRRLLAGVGALSLIAAAVLAAREFPLTDTDVPPSVVAEGNGAGEEAFKPAPPSDSLLKLFDGRMVALEDAIESYRKAEQRFAQQRLSCPDLGRAYQAVDEGFINLSRALVPFDAQRTARYAQLVGESSAIETAFGRSGCPRP